MRKSLIVKVVVLSATGLLLAALPQDPAPGRVPLKFVDRLQPLIGKAFIVPADGSRVLQHKSGDFKLVSVCADYAEFHSDDSHVLIPLGELRVWLLGQKGVAVLDGK